MHRTLARRVLMLVLTLSSLLCGLAARTAAESIYIAGANGLYNFDSAAPDAFTSRRITGLRSGESMAAIDFRPANGQLYGLSNQSNIYTIDTVTGAASFVTTIPPFIGPFGPSVFSTGIDFDPVTDRLRIVNGVGATDTVNDSFIVNVDTGETEVETPLRFAAGDVDAGRPSFISSIAHTNNFAGASLTTVYGVDGSRLVTINPEDSTTNTVGVFSSTGGNQLFGFDISGVSGIAYGISNSLGTRPDTSIFSVDLRTGETTLLGRIPMLGLFTIAAPVGVAQVAPVPEPATLMLLGSGVAGVAAASRRRRRSK